MKFEPVLLLPYGQYDGKNEVFKLIFEDTNNSFLKLEGFFIRTKNSEEMIIVTDLNNTYEYKTLNIDDNTKVYKVKDLGNVVSVSISNNMVKGYPKIIEAEVSIPNNIAEINTDNTYHEYLEKIKDINIGLYIYLNINIAAEASLLKNQYSKEEIVGSFLYNAALNDKDFLNHVSSNKDLFKKIFKTIFIDRVLLKLNIENIYRFNKTVNAYNDTYVIDSVYNFIYFIKMSDLPNSILKSYVANIIKYDEATIELNSKKVFPLKEVEDTLLSLMKITRVSVSFNGVIKEFDIFPVYQRDILDIKNSNNTEKIYYFEGSKLISDEEDIYKPTGEQLIMYFNTKKHMFQLTYNDGANIYETDIVMNKDFVENPDLSKFFSNGNMSITFKNTDINRFVPNENNMEEFVTGYRGNQEIKLGRTPFNKFAPMGCIRGYDHNGYLKRTDTDIVYSVGECNFHGEVKMVFDLEKFRRLGVKKVSFLAYSYGYYSHKEQVVTDKGSYSLPRTGWCHGTRFNKYEFNLNEINSLKIRMFGERYCSGIYFTRLRLYS